MQSEPITTLSCKCGKNTSRILRIDNNGDSLEITIHFTKKSTYWHISKNGKKPIRTFKMPENWQ